MKLSTNFFKLIAIALLLSPSILYAQNIVNGIVKDSKGAPVPYASVLIRTTSAGITADSLGKFSLKSPIEPPFFIRISSVGFKPQDFQILKFQDVPYELELVSDDQLADVVVTSRRRSELLQDVPIPVSVIGGSQVDKTGAFNVNRIKELIPTLQLYTSNPRNTSILSMSTKSRVAAAGRA